MSNNKMAGEDNVESSEDWVKAGKKFYKQDRYCSICGAELEEVGHYKEVKREGFL